MRLVLLDGAIGVLVLATIAFACTRTHPPRPRWLRTTGWLLVAVPLPLAVVLHPGQVPFLASVVAFAVGAALILGDEEQDWNRGDVDEDETPPWWPAFERDLREYERDATRRTEPLRS
jgi:hypothetical protein